ncbi:MAG: hypothetical protein RLZZ399_2617 [Verrucomicrobiota bacterium]
MAHPSDPPPAVAELVARILTGERDLFLHLVRQHELMLRSYLASQLYNLSEVDDLAQETLIAAFRDLATFRTETDFGAWLRGIARHRLLTHFRSLQRRASAVQRFQEEVTQRLSEELERAAQKQHDAPVSRLLHCVSKLPDKLRKVVHAGLQGSKPDSLAEELGTTVPAIYQLHYRANQLLRECLKKEVPS